MNWLRKQRCPLALALLTVPAWWLATPDVDPNSNDPVAAIDELQENAYFSDFSLLKKYKAHWDMSHHGSAYAKLYLRAARMRVNRPDFYAWPTLSIAPDSILKPLVREMPNQEPRIRCAIGHLIHFPDEDPTFYGHAAAVLIADPVDYNREAGVNIAMFMAHVPDEVKVLVQSKNNAVANAARRVVENNPLDSHAIVNVEVVEALKYPKGVRR
jgi:hypothetical protein